MIKCTENMSPPTDIKPKIIDLEDNESLVSEPSRKDFDDTPAWILEFSAECLKINGLRNPEKLDQLMGDYLELLRADLLLCQTSPNRSQHVVFRMQKTLSFFYNYFLDIKEMFFVTQWNENMIELMAIYSYLEIKASLRPNRRDSDLCIATRIYKLLYLYFDGNEEHIIHTFLKTPLQNLKCKGIYDSIFRKALVTNREKRSQTYSDLEYVRNLLCYKLWKTMCPKEDKKHVTEFAIAHNKPPSTLAKNIRKYRFFPKFLDHTDLNRSLSTCIFQIEDGIREYFERHEPKNGKHFGSIVSKERKTFISRLYDVFCETDSTTENIGDSFMDNILLDQIKTETEAIQLDDDDSDDDCVFVDPNAPLPPPPPTEPVVKMVIDLTSNEPDCASSSDPIDLTPIWCKRLLIQAKLAEEQLLSSPANHDPIDNCNSINASPINWDNTTENNFTPINHKTETPTINTYKDTPQEEDYEMINSIITQIQPINGTNTHFTLPDMDYEPPIDNNPIINPTTHDSNTMAAHTPTHPQPPHHDALKPATDTSITINSETNMPKLHFEPLNNNITTINSNTSTLHNSNLKLAPIPQETITNCETTNEPVNKIENAPITTNAEHPIIRCKSVDLEFKPRDFDIASANDVDEILTKLNTTSDLNLYEPEVCDPETHNINRENINKTPLDIVDDFSSSDGFSEITSTSHDFDPVQLQPILLQTHQVEFETPIPSLNQTKGGFDPPRCKTPYPLQTSPKTPVQVSKKPVQPINAAIKIDWDHDRVDSTSGLNEDSCAAPVITPLVRDQTQSDNLSDELSNQSEPTPITETLAAAFIVKPTTDHSIDTIVSTPKIPTKVHDLSKLVPQFKESSDSESESSSNENNLVISNHNGAGDEKVESDDQSPSIEPICGKDFAGYLTDFSMATYADFQRKNENADLTVNKSVKIRTYNPIKPRAKPVVPVENPPDASVSAPAVSEHRVPVNGEKILRFETELWEPVFLNTFKLTKKEFNLFNPQITVHKCDKRDFGIHDDDEPVFPVSKPSVSAAKSSSSNSFEALHSQLFNVARTNSILERQDYVKGAKHTRALVQTRPLRSRSATLRNSVESTSLKSPNSVNQTKKRGIDLNLLFSSPDCSVSLNNSFQHHFCSDISTCASNCLSPTLNLSSSLDNAPNHSDPQLKTVHNHLNSQLNNKSPPTLETFANPQLKVPNYSNIRDKTPQTHPKPQLNTITTPQLTDKLPPSHHPNLQFNVQICDELSQTPLNHSIPQSKPQHTPEPSSVPQHSNAQIRVNFSHADPAGLESVPILPPPAPQPALIPDLNTYWQNANPDQQSLMGTNLLVNINVDQSNTDHEIHLPIKKRRVSSLKVEIKDEISYPSTPMISIAELENIKTEQRNIRPFKTAAELKEVPPLPPSYLLTVPNHVVTDNLNINHTFNNPTINYHVNNVPVINFQYTPHYHQLPPLQPILVPVSRTANWQQPGYSYLPTSKVAAATATGKKRNSRATERKKTKTKS